MVSPKIARSRGAERVTINPVSTKSGAVHPRAVGGGEPLTDSALEVVPPLVGGVDTPEAHPERELGEDLGAVFLPGGAVEEIGNGCGMVRWHRVILHWWWALVDGRTLWRSPTDGS